MKSQPGRAFRDASIIRTLVVVLVVGRWGPLLIKPPGTWTNQNLMISQRPLPTFQRKAHKDHFPTWNFCFFQTDTSLRNTLNNEVKGDSLVFFSLLLAYGYLFGHISVPLIFALSTRIMHICPAFMPHGCEQRKSSSGLSPLAEGWMDFY
jgi:hypothetical protein